MRRPAGSSANNHELANFPVGQIVGRMNTVRRSRDVIQDMVEEAIATQERMARLYGA